MIESGSKQVKSKVLVVEQGLADLDTALGRSAHTLITELEDRGVIVIGAYSYQDGLASIVSDAGIHALLISWQLPGDLPDRVRPAVALVQEFRKRHEKSPVFLVAETSHEVQQITEDVMSQVDEFVWLLEDTADFIAGRVMAAIRRYRAQLLPPYARVLAEYSQAARAFVVGARSPGRHRVHQASGGARLLRLSTARTSFRTDMGIERGALGSLLDHTGPVARKRDSTRRACSARTAATQASSAPRARTAASCRPA